MKRVIQLALVLAAALAAASCDKVPLLAPSNSTITLTANATSIPTGGTVGLTAFVAEGNGSAVQNGTTVRFTTTLGTVTPVEAQTTNGIAVATFSAGNQSGVAEIHAVSGGTTTTTGGSGGTGGTTTTATNVVKITVGAAAVNTITLRATPSTVSPGGSSVQLIATVVGDSGNGLPGIPVTFNSDQGTVSPQIAVTDGLGVATSTLTSSSKATVTATAGLKTSSSVTVDVRTGPGVTISCAVASAGSGTSCAAMQANANTNNVTVTFTVGKATGTSNLQNATLNFGDGSSQSLGTLSGGNVTVSHIYGGPSGSSPVGYTATVTATDVNGETASASTTVTVTPRATLAVDLAADTGTAATPKVGKPVTFTATITGGDVQKLEWDFGDGTTATTTSPSPAKITHVYTANGQYTATVTVTTSDGRTATGRVEFIVSGI